MTAQEVVKFAQENGCQMVDYKFLDFVGIWQHFTQPISEFSEETFEEGIGFDGSSIRGWQPIHNSDMLIMPDPKTAKIDPFPHVPTLSLICNIIDPFTREGYSRDPRFVAQKAEAYLKSTGIADTCLLRAGAGILHLRRRPLRLRPRTRPSTSSTRSKGAGTPAARSSPTSATSRATRAATSRLRRPTP